MNESYSKYERCLISAIFEHADRKFKTQIEFARKVWPGKSDPNVNTKIRAIREKNSRGKPQGLKIEDAAKMAEVLDIPLSSLALEAETKLRLGWSEDIENSQLVLVTAPEKKEAPQEAGHEGRSASAASIEVGHPARIG